MRVVSFDISRDCYIHTSFCSLHPYALVPSAVLDGHVKCKGMPLGFGVFFCGLLPLLLWDCLYAVFSLPFSYPSLRYTPCAHVAHRRVILEHSLKSHRPDLLTDEQQHES